MRVVGRSGVSRLVVSVAAVLVVGCSPMPPGPGDGGEADAGTPDAGVSDAGAADAGTNDAGPSDAGPDDAGTSDAGSPDAGADDAGLGDAGSPDAGPGDAGATDAGTLGTGRLEGRVTEALAGGRPVPGALVEAAGQTTVASATGDFLFTQLPTGVPLQLKARGPAGAPFSTTQREVVAPATGTAFATLELLRGCTTTVDVSADAGVVTPRGCGHADARVGLVLPQGGVVDATGAPVAAVKVDLAVLPVALGGRAASDALRAFPGDMQALTATGGSTWLESRGAVEVRLSHPVTGAPLRLASGRTAVVTFSASEATFDEPSVPAWYFDEAQGRWVEEGSMTLAVDPLTGAMVHRLEVSHFTWWNADKPAETTCLTGRLLGADGGVLASTSVQTFGVSYLGQSGVLSANDGRFSVFARRSSEAELVAAARAGTVVAERRLRVQTNPDATCADVGDVVVDTERLLACAAGRVVSELGMPLGDIAVTAFASSATTATVSAADGSFCVPVPPGERFDVLLAGEVGAVPVRTVHGGKVAAVGSGACGGAGCTALGDLQAEALGCIAGRVLDGAGVVAGARVLAHGPSNLATALTSAAGDYCLPLQRSGLVDFTALTFQPARVASAPRQDAPSTPAACGSMGCATVDLVLADAACVRGVVTEPGGAPMAGVSVRVAPTGGGRPVSVVTGAGGAFCAPMAAGTSAVLELTASRPGTRFFATVGASAPAMAASCGGSGCTDVGTVALSATSFSTCLKGRLRDGPGPLRDRLDVLAANRLAILRPREDGTYCVDLPVVPSVTLQDPEARAGCARLRETPVSLASAQPASCADESGCVEGGDLDFAAFCASS
jgi:hypothetical protein